MHRLLRRPGLARAGAAVLVVVLAAIGVVTAFASTHRPTPDVYAVDARGHIRPSGSSLHVGERVVVHARGFAPRASVEVVDVSRRAIRHVTADGSGVARWPFIVPARRSQLDFAGATRQAPDTGPAAARAATAAQRDRQPVAATVPLLRRFVFTVNHGRGHGNGNGTGGGVAGVGLGVDNGVHTGAGSGSGSSGHQTDGLASTGTDVLLLLVAAGLLLLIGAGIVRIARHRRA